MRLSSSTLCCFFLYAALPLAAFANNNTENQGGKLPGALLEQAKEKQLAQSRQWLSLLHYNQGGTLRGRKQSYVKSPAFFLDAQGHRDPEAELGANIRAFFAEDITQRCRFPARFHWLSQQLDQGDYREGLSHCQDLLTVQQKMQAKKLTLIFPSAYMGSASSLFGHTLFRIDSSDDDESVILNWAINYGAKIDTSDSAFEYAMKGIGGAYQGQYFVVPYAQKIKEYGQMENRDIWEYSLNLDEQELTLLTEHLWELQDIDFDYYFFDDNCSFRLLSLLEVAKPELDLTSRLRLTEIPVNTVKALHNQNLIEDAVFRPSKERILKARVAALNKKEITQALALANTDIALETSLGNKTFANLPGNTQVEIVQAAYDLLRFRQSQQVRDEAIAKRSLALLSEINRLTQQADIKPLIVDVAEDSSILLAHDSQRLRIGLGQKKGQQRFANVEYRMAYHDLLDNSTAYLPGAQIEGPAIHIEHTNSDTLVESWTLVDILSLNPVNVIRQDFSWRISIKGERQSAGQQHLSSIVQAGGGYSWHILDVLHYQLLLPRFEKNPAFEQHTKAGGQYLAGFLYQQGRYGTLLELSATKLQDETLRKHIQWSQQFALSRNHGLRLQAEWYYQEDKLVFDQARQVSFDYLYYF